MRKVPGKYLLLIVAVAAVAALGGIYHRYGSRTRVAFVNYPDYILAPLLDQEINPESGRVFAAWRGLEIVSIQIDDAVQVESMGMKQT